jgi:hypothetical protein
MNVNVTGTLIHMSCDCTRPTRDTGHKRAGVSHRARVYGAICKSKRYNLRSSVVNSIDTTGAHMIVNLPGAVRESSPA